MHSLTFPPTGQHGFFCSVVIPVGLFKSKFSVCVTIDIHYFYYLVNFALSISSLFVELCIF